MVVALLLGAAATARADGGDGLYGRFDGDLVLSAGLGGGVTLGDEGGATGLVDLRARFLDTGGLVLAPQLGPGGALRVVAGVEVRPLFPALFLLGAWTGSAFWDLLIDSVGFELGVAVDRVADDERGVGLMLGFGLDVPLLLPDGDAEGLFLRLAARHVRAGEWDLNGPAGGASDWMLHAVLTFRGLTSLGLATREPPRFRPE